MTGLHALSAAVFAGALTLGFAGTANAQYYGDRDYGNYGNAGNQERLRCDSRDGRQNICRPSATASQIRLARKFSKAQCIQNRSFGLTREGMVWVSNGCRADFILTRSRWERSPRGNAYGYGRNYGNRNDQGNQYGYGAGEYGNQYGYGNGQIFRCESHDGRENFCNVNTRAGIQILRQISNTPCINGRTWGVTNNGVWVNNGCRAEFVVGRY